MKKIELFVNGEAYGEWQIPDDSLGDLEDWLDEAAQETDK